MALEQRIGPGSYSGQSSNGEEDHEVPPKNYRGRLQGLKMSVEKLANIRIKIAETRAKVKAG